MALLSAEQRQQIFKALGYGEYNTENILKMQKKNFPQYKSSLKVNNWDGVYGTDCDNFIRHEYNVKRYTKNFAPSEFKCDCGGRFCTGYPTFMKPSILSTLQLERDHYGKPMIVTSGMRCNRRNKELNGSIVNSRHLLGLATDHYMQGVTDTVANRRNTLNWLKTTPYFRWGYGNGVSSTGTTSAPYMGNALHIDCDDVPVTDSTPVVTKEKYAGELPSLPISTSTNNAGMMANYAVAMSWAWGTPEKYWSYTTGAPTQATKSAMKNRGYTSKINMSDCGHTMDAIIYGVFGLKVNVLGGVKEAFKPVKGFNIVVDGTSVKLSQLKCGDIIRYKKSADSQHVVMFIGLDAEGTPIIVEGGRKVRFSVVRATDKFLGKKKHLQVLRVVEGTTSKAYLEKGDNNAEVLKMQKFLNWYGYQLAEDSIFGDMCHKAVVDFQYRSGLTQDGLWGNDCNKKAKEYEK